MKHEISILSSLKHEYIVKFLGAEENRKTALLLLEYMEGVWYFINVTVQFAHMFQSFVTRLILVVHIVLAKAEIP